jgi:hypothetical protein
MYSRRYSPLSTTGVIGEKIRGQKGEELEGGIRHQKSLDEIVETLSIFTARCNILLDPLLQLTDFLSTQQTATMATTRPALTSLLLRILMVLPIWVLLTLPPLRILTTQRIVLAFGTLGLTWHSRPARISRIILWRSLTVRHLVSLLTGLPFQITRAELATGAAPDLPPRRKSQHDLALSLASSTKSRASSAVVRFTFTTYENQRRWLGLGWTSSLFSYERAAWTDEHMNPSQPKDEFTLPAVEGSTAHWRWVSGSEWRTDGAPKTPGSSTGSSSSKVNTEGWVYYDNKARPRCFISCALSIFATLMLKAHIAKIRLT